MSKIKKRPPYNQNSAIRGALRRAFSRSPAVREILEESRREVPKYKKDGTLAKKPAVQRQCQVCDEWVGSTKLAVDHINPVISVTDGFQDWNEFIARLWCDKTNLQRICHTCHDAKTYAERIARTLKKDGADLSALEETVKCWEQGQPKLTKDQLKNFKKQLARYVAKKKSVGLEPISKRALALRDRIKNLKI
jgi:hypothetical protein